MKRVREKENLHTQTQLSENEWKKNYRNKKRCKEKGNEKQTNDVP